MEQKKDPKAGVVTEEDTLGSVFLTGVDDGKAAATPLRAGRAGATRGVGGAAKDAAGGGGAVSIHIAGEEDMDEEVRRQWKRCISESSESSDRGPGFQTLVGRLRRQLELVSQERDVYKKTVEAARLMTSQFFELAIEEDTLQYQVHLQLEAMTTQASHHQSPLFGIPVFFHGSSCPICGQMFVVNLKSCSPP